MRIADKMTARWRAHQDRKMLRSIPVRETPANLAGKPTGPGHRVERKVKRRRQPATTSNRARRRSQLRDAGPIARASRLDTHMRRPIMSMRCSVKLGRRDAHRKDRRRAREEAWAALRKLAAARGAREPSRS